MDHYEALGVSPNAPESVIRAAYKARIRETHPDSGGRPEEAQAVNDAFGVLSDPEKRASYDRTREPEAPPTGPQTASSAPTRAASGAPSTPRSQASSTPPQSLSGDIPVPRKWWMSPTLWTLSALWVVSLVVMFLAEATPSRSAIAGLSLVASVVLVGTRRSPKTYIGALIIGSFAAGFLMPWGYAAAAATIALVVAVVLAVRRERRGWLAYSGDVLLTTTEMQDGVEMYFVEAADGGPSRTTVRLSRADDGAQFTETLWGVIPPGVYIALADEGDSPLWQATADALSCALKVRAR